MTPYLFFFFSTNRYCTPTAVGTTLREEYGNDSYASMEFSVKWGRKTSESGISYLNASDYGPLNQIRNLFTKYTISLVLFTKAKSMPSHDPAIPLLDAEPRKMVHRSTKRLKQEYLKHLYSY